MAAHVYTGITQCLEEIEKDAEGLKNRLGGAVAIGAAWLDQNFDVYWVAAQWVTGEVTDEQFKRQFAEYKDYEERNWLSLEKPATFEEWMERILRPKIPTEARPRLRILNRQNFQPQH